MTSYQNPVYAEYFADPFAFRVGHEYFAVGTGPAEAAGQTGRAGTRSVFPVLHSTNLVEWRSLGRALVRPSSALGDSYWAPEIAQHGGQYYLYYSVGFGDRRHHLRVAVSDHPAGPYEDSSRELTDPEACAFAIDPHPFRDRDGRWYLFHARDFLTADGGERAGTALVVHALKSMTELETHGETVLRARSDWQRFAANRSMYGRVFDWHTLEGPALIERDGRYYCFYSGGCWQTESYGVDYGVAARVLGPYDDAGNESGPRVLRTVPSRVIGPGHNSIVLGPDDATSYLVYHAWDPGLTARRLCIDPLEWTDDAGPRCPGPSTDRRELRSANP